MFSSKTQRPSNKQSNTNDENIFYELLVMAVQETPKPLQAVADCLPEVEGRFLLLETLCTSDTGSRGP